jgi:hypothetical protein
MLWCFRATPTGAALITGIKGTIWKSDGNVGGNRSNDIELQTSPFERHGSMNAMNPMSSERNSSIIGSSSFQKNPLRKSFQAQVDVQPAKGGRGKGQTKNKKSFGQTKDISELSIPAVMVGFAVDAESANDDKTPTIDRREMTKHARTEHIMRRARKGGRGKAHTKNKKSFGQNRARLSIASSTGTGDETKIIL